MKVGQAKEESSPTFHNIFSLYVSSYTSQSIFDHDDTLEECKMMRAIHGQKIVNDLNERFLDLLFSVQSIIQVLKKFL